MPSFRHLLARGLDRCISPIIPIKARLAFNYQVARVQGYEPELAVLSRIGPNRGASVDAGANEGLYTYRLAGLYDQVYSFEINPVLADQLRPLVSPKVTVNSVGLSSREGSSTLFTPFYRSRLLHGWASLESGHCPVAERYVETTVAIRPLDSFKLKGITFLKADVEGHELELLAGAMDTLRRNRPVVLLEVQATNLVQVRTLFNELGYAERQLADLAGVRGSPDNYIFVPA